MPKTYESFFLSLEFQGLNENDSYNKTSRKSDGKRVEQRQTKSIVHAATRRGHDSKRVDKYAMSRVTVFSFSSFLQEEPY